MMSMNPQNNSIMIVGKIVGDIQFSHLTRELKFYTATVSVTRLSGTVDNIPVLFSQRYYEQAMLLKNAPVLLKGQIRTYNKDIDGHNKLIVTMFVQEVLPPAPVQVNDVCLYGTICREPTYRVTPFGKQICDLMIAVNRDNGKSDYIPCIAWGRTAKYASYLRVGDKLAVSGRFQSRDYQKQMDDGNVTTKTAYEVSIHHLQTEGDLLRQYSHEFASVGG